MSIFAGVPLWLWGFTLSGCLQTPIKRAFGTKFNLCECVLFCLLCLHACVFGPACVWVLLWLPRLKALVMKPIHYASLHTEKGLFSLWVEEGKHLHCCLCESSLSNCKTRCIGSANLTSQIWKSSHLGTFSSCLISCLSDSLYFSNFLTIICLCLFLLWCAFLFRWTHCWSLHVEYSKELYHIMETASCQDDFIMSQSVLCLTPSSHSFHASLHHCKSTQPVLWHFI